MSRSHLCFRGDSGYFCVIIYRIQHFFVYISLCGNQNKCILSLVILSKISLLVDFTCLQQIPILCKFLNQPTTCYLSCNPIMFKLIQFHTMDYKMKQPFSNIPWNQMNGWLCADGHVQWDIFCFSSLWKEFITKNSNCQLCICDHYFLK